MDKIKEWAGVMALGAILVGLLLGAAQNNYPGPRGYELTGPATGVFDCVQHDTNPLSHVARAVRFSAAGTITFRCVDGSIGEETVEAGDVLPIQMDQIFDTGTDIPDANIHPWK